ncbi:hypothetical protein THIOSC13_990001 [uncultured Thiomicrorhabdus sp.]
MALEGLDAKRGKQYLMVLGSVNGGI